MKKLRSTLFFIFCIFSIAIAQDFRSQTDAPIPGAFCPHITLSTLTAEGFKEVSLADYKGKVVILEFWGTFCKPCLPAMHHLEIIEAAMHNQLKVFAITDEPREKIENFLTKYPTGATIVIDHYRELNNLFYHHFIPTTVVIAPDGKVVAYTQPDQITTEKLNNLLAGNIVDFHPMMEYQTTTPLNTSQQQTLDLAYENLSNNRSIVVNTPPKASSNTVRMNLSSHETGKKCHIDRENLQHISFTNCSLSVIYQTLFEVPASRLVFEMPPEKTACYTFDTTYSYCFELEVPEYWHKSLKDIGKQQLESFFELRAKIDVRQRPSMVLVRDSLCTINDSIPLATHNNGTLEQLMQYIENQGKSDGLPVVNKTGLRDDFPIDFDNFLKSTASLNEKLAVFGFRREEGIQSIPCLILYEKP